MLDNWMQDIAEKWLQARGWLQDVKYMSFKEAWMSICKGAIQDAWVQYEVMKQEASRILKDKGDIDESLRMEEDCKAIKENLEVHIKKCMFLMVEEHKGQYEEERRELVYKALNSLTDGA